MPIRLCNYVDVYKNDRITSAIPFMSATASQDEIERFRLKQGDVLITKDSEAWDDIGVPDSGNRVSRRSCLWLPFGFASLSQQFARGLPSLDLAKQVGCISVSCRGKGRDAIWSYSQWYPIHLPSPPRAIRHRSVPVPRGPALSAVHRSKGKADPPIGRGAQDRHSRCRTGSRYQESTDRSSRRFG